MSTGAFQGIAEQGRVPGTCRGVEPPGDTSAAGIGIAPVPALLFDDPAFKDVLIPILPNYPLQQATLYVVYASRKFVLAKLRTFVDFIAEFLSSDYAPPRIVGSEGRSKAESQYRISGKIAAGCPAPMTL